MPAATYFGIIYEKKRHRLLDAFSVKYKKRKRKRLTSKTFHRTRRSFSFKIL